MLEHGRSEDKIKLVEIICEKASLLSRHRYANILVQKCIRQMNAAQMESLVQKFKGQTPSLATHPHGCRVVQSLLECGSPESVHTVIFEEINRHIDDLIQDEHSNYVVQQMLDQGTAADRTLVIQKVSKNFIPLAQNKFSTNVVQKCLHAMNQDELGEIATAVSGHVFELASHPYSVHVIQILFAVAPPDLKTEIFEETVRDEFIVPICQDQYGNYSMQHMIEHGTPQQRERILEEVIARLFQLSCHKFASNVVTKALNFAAKEQRAHLVSHACSSNVSSAFQEGATQKSSISSSSSSSGSGATVTKDRKKEKVMIVAMSEDPYANYVVQKMIEVSEEENLVLITKTIAPFSSKLSKIPYAKGVLSKLPAPLSNGVA